MAPQRNSGAGAEAELPEYAGHYRLESCLGSGGMGVVHLARSTSGMKLAVKVVHAEFARDPEFRGRFRQEVAAVRRVSGAFTAPVVDADPEAERPWMATLFIPGPTLSDQVKRNGPMTPDRLRRLMAGLAEALRDIHRAGVVHRDLKPSNVLLAEDGPKVIDFGISRPTDSELRTETGKLIGTPPFMAPEQFRRPREVGPAADVFALGSVMVHAATGRGPFDSDSPYIVAYQVVHDEPDLTGVPGNLAPLILRCLAKDPEDRPTPDELMRDLRSVAASYDTQAFIPAQRPGDAQPSEPPSEPPSGSPSEPPSESGAGAPRAARPAAARARRKVLLASGALLLAAGGVFGCVQLLAPGRADVPRETATRAASAEVTSWTSPPLAGGGGMPRCSYGAGALLCVTPGQVLGLDPSDGRVLWRHRSEAAYWSAAPVVAGGLVQPLADHGSRLEALDPASGGVRREWDVPAYSGIGQAAGMLLLTGTDGTVRGVDAATGGTKWQRRFPGAVPASFSSFAGDSAAYLTTPSADGSSTEVTAVDAATGDVRWKARLDGTLRLFGSAHGSVFFLSVDAVYADAQTVVRYTPASGATRTVPLPVRRQSARATVHGDTVYLLAAGGSLEAVDMDGGKRQWHVETSLGRGSAPVSDGHVVLVSAADGRLLAFAARSGELVGQTRARLGADADRVPAVLPEPLMVGTHVFASAPDGTVFAVDGRNPSDW
ncbi:PQQ-binding-like beta-propeller repeat protein [Streptomyces actuosus]|uniref:PQQ-binding-like beta-propeller repeat protein n=1 Tax=Streptomyces actuosus TaxID=1885 RepID=A0ABS2VYR9_STRAS|nr:serine/threonine-protein kinase [Streptomyces actuosus]MBN0048125.1 PQQ-binding-like beta-propeller repeat protein [Streptomyces actuosus]